MQARYAGITQEIRSRVDAHVQPVVRIASSWEKTEKGGKAKWAVEARRLIEHFPACQAVEWVDARNRVRWAVSRDEGRVSEGMRAFPDKEKLRILNAARDAAYAADFQPGKRS